MVRFSKVNGKIFRGMELGRVYMQMALFTKEDLLIIKDKAMEYFNMQMVMFTKESFSMTKSKEKASLRVLEGITMMEIL